LSFTFMNVSKKDERKENRIIQKKIWKEMRDQINDHPCSI
jgi:hypothetical protein